MTFPLSNAIIEEAEYRCRSAALTASGVVRRHRRPSDMEKHTASSPNVISPDIPYGYCQCGCGQKTRLAKRTRPSQGHIQGQPYRFLPGHNARVKTPTVIIPTDDGALIPLKSRRYPGLFSLIDEADVPLVVGYQWHPRKERTGFYAHASYTVNGKYHSVALHRLLLNAPIGRLVDHKNHNTLDNRRSNLRLATRSENTMNAFPPIGGTSRFKGVYWSNRHSKWYAKIKKDGKVKNLGVYPVEEDAAIAYDEAARELFGEYALTNEAMGLYAGLLEGDDDGHR